MFKLILLAKKNPELTREEFLDYYNNRHVPFMHDILANGAAIHRRNFVIPSAPVDVDIGENTDPNTDNDYDVITEVFYEDYAAAEAAMRSFSDPEVQKLAEEDENKFLQRGSIRKYVVEVHETVFRPIPGHGV